MTDTIAAIAAITIPRLDYSKPLPGYVVRFEDSSMANGDGPPLWWWGHPEYAASAGEEDDGLAAAWSHYKREHDPPGMKLMRAREEALLWWSVWVTTSEGWRKISPNPQAWADGDSEDSDKADARAFAWAWHDSRLALAAKLDGGTFCPKCHSQDAYVEAIDDKTTTQPWCTECDVEMGGLFDDIWPRCLTWSDEQISEIERWRADSTAEMPDVLREETPD